MSVVDKSPTFQRPSPPPSSGESWNVGLLSTTDMACCSRRFYQVQLLWKLKVLKFIMLLLYTDIFLCKYSHVIHILQPNTGCPLYDARLAPLWEWVSFLKEWPPNTHLKIKIFMPVLQPYFMLITNCKQCWPSSLFTSDMQPKPFYMTCNVQKHLLTCPYCAHIATKLQPGSPEHH
jgi:hypothetical protein